MMPPELPLPSLKRAASFVAAFLVLAVSAQAAPPMPPAASPSPTLPPPAPISDLVIQKQRAEGREVILTALATRNNAFREATAALDAAGGISAESFKTKADIAACRLLVDACVTANESLVTLINTEPQVLREELGKVGMAPNLIDQYVANFTPDPKTPQLLQMRVLAREIYRQMNEALTLLDQSWGKWRFADGKLSFQKVADTKKYSAIVGSIGKAINSQAALQAQLAPKPDSDKIGAGAPVPVPGSQ
jgi:hypothetical protein